MCVCVCVCVCACVCVCVHVCAFQGGGTIYLKLNIFPKDESFIVRKSNTKHNYFIFSQALQSFRLWEAAK